MHEHLVCSHLNLQRMCPLHGQDAPSAHPRISLNWHFCSAATCRIFLKEKANPISHTYIFKINVNFDSSTTAMIAVEREHYSSPLKHSILNYLSIYL